MNNKIYLNISADSTDINSLRQDLANIKAWGFDGAEIGLKALPLMISGKINQPFVDYVQGILQEYDLSYSAHIADGLDLRTSDSLELHKKALHTSIDICAQLSLSPLVLHFEQDSGDAAVEAQFLRFHREAAEYAATRSVALVLENIEIEHYLPALEMVKAINHPNLTMCLDVGHLYLSAKLLDYSFEDAVRACAPYVSHCHMHDNTGIFEHMRIENHHLYNTLPMSYRIAYGRGDIHMPPLYCDVPIPFVIEELKKAGYQGIYACEYPGKTFTPFNAEICSNLRALIEK